MEYGPHPPPVFHKLRALARSERFRVTLLCTQCGSSEFQSSRLRLSDFSRLLRLQLPVRCRACMKRRYAPISFARQAPRPVRKEHHKPAR